MCVMILVEAARKSEAGVMPSAELLAAMGIYNELLACAGILAAGAGLQPSSKDRRVAFDGPFVQSSELIAGSGCGRSRIWPTPLNGLSVVQIRCPDIAISRSARCSRPPTSGKSSHHRLPTWGTKSAPSGPAPNPPSLSALFCTQSTQLHQVNTGSRTLAPRSAVDLVSNPAGHLAQPRTDLPVRLNHRTIPIVSKATYLSPFCVTCPIKARCAGSSARRLSFSFVVLRGPRAE